MADQFSWRGSSSGSWNTPENWFDSTLGAIATRAPASGDTAEFFAGTYRVTGPGSASALNLLDGAQITLAGTGSEVFRPMLLDIGANTQMVVDEAVLEANSVRISPNGILDVTDVPPRPAQPFSSPTTVLANLTLVGPSSDPGVVNPSGGRLIIGDSIIEVFTVINGNSGIGNAFDARAGIIGSGTLLQAPFSDHARVRVLQDGKPITSLDFGIVNAGDVASQQFTLTNFAGNSGGPLARGALQTTVDGGNVTDPALSGSGVTAQNFVIGGRGGSQSYEIVLDTSQARSLEGQALHIAYQFNRGLLDQGDTLAITGTVLAGEAAAIDWNAVAARVQAAFNATGIWYDPGEAVIAPAPTPVDWNALAEQAQANFAATGQWFL